MIWIWNVSFVVAKQIILIRIRELVVTTAKEVDNKNANTNADNCHQHDYRVRVLRLPGLVDWPPAILELDAVETFYFGN